MDSLPGPVPVLPYPRVRNDCGLCREMDADFEVEALDGSSWTCRPRRFCQGCIGKWMATMASLRSDDIPPGVPLAVTLTSLRPGGGTW